MRGYVLLCREGPDTSVCNLSNVLTSCWVTSVGGIAVIVVVSVGRKKSDVDGIVVLMGGLLDVASIHYTENFMGTEFHMSEDENVAVAVPNSPDVSIHHDHKIGESIDSAVESYIYSDDDIARMPKTCKGMKPYDGLEAMVKLPVHVRGCSRNFLMGE